MTFAVWATSGAAPGSFCKQPDSPAGKSYPEGDEFGQAGWDAVVGFDRAESLARNLSADSRIKGKLIDRLAINAHGDPGHFDIDTQCSGPLTQSNTDVYPKLLSLDTWARFEPALRAVGDLVAANGTIILMGCNSGRGAPGTALLLKLSTLWAGRNVVAMTTVGWTAQRARPDRMFGACQNPGMRDTDYESPGFGDDAAYRRYGDGKATQLPWASESSTHAKVARNGVITRDPEPKLGQDPAAFMTKSSWGWPQVAKGPRDPEIIVFIFPDGSNCSWQGFRFGADNAEALLPVTQKWPGSWRVEGGKVVFEFPSDPPNWHRVWTVDTLSQVSKVSVRIGGKLMSTFEMSKRT